MKNWIAFLLMGALVGYGASAATAERQIDSGAGAVTSHGVMEEFDMSLGLTPSGNPKKDTIIREFRTQLNVPDHYGTLIHITSAGDQAVLWYRDSDGVIRNAVVGQVSERLGRIEKTATERYELEEPR